MQERISRRHFLQVTGGVSLATLLSACGGFGVGGQSTSGTGTTITVWDIRTGNDQTIINEMASAFNSQHSNMHAVIEYFQNDPYKLKLQVAMGAKHPPDIFFGWGGGILKTYVDAGDVYDMTGALNADSSWKNRYLPSVMTGVTFNGKVYGVPNSGAQPVVFLYNKDLFAKYHLTPPTTWNALLQTVGQLKQNGVLPIALGGGSKWPYLMYEEYLVDRVGGPSAFDAVVAKQSSAWSNPAFIKANTMIQQLVSVGAFGTNFASVSYDTGQAGALLYTGKAAMHLMGVWEFNAIESNSPDFISSGKLGWFAFPTVEGGTGDPKNLAGNLCNFYSIASASKASQASLTYLKEAVLSDAEVSKFINNGEVPPVQGIESKLSGAPHGDWLLFIYHSILQAPHYQLSWDQALPAQPSQAILTNLDQLFLNQINPQQFSANMNQTLGS
ncbi:MAG: extracellular solute-binding protein [Chloroflexi bacterium]|nr:MAG: extracellular solute-binding protein [Chloroflexota bacterium]